MAGSYKIRLTKAARRFLEKTDGETRARIGRGLRALSSEPWKKAAKLKGSEYYRTRIRNHRIIFEIIDEELIVLVILIGDRKDVFQRLKRILK